MANVHYQSNKSKMETHCNGCLLSCKPNTKLSKRGFFLFNSLFDIDIRISCGSYQALSIHCCIFSLSLGLSNSIHIKTHCKYVSSAKPPLLVSLIDRTCYFQWLLTLFTTFSQKQSGEPDCVRTNESDSIVISQQIPSMLHRVRLSEWTKNTAIIRIVKQNVFFSFGIYSEDLKDYEISA